MILIEDIIISDEVLEKNFICNLKACKGACCVEGDGGAPLELEEAQYLEQNIDIIAPFITKEGLEQIKIQGAFVVDEEKEYTEWATPLINGAACVYVNYGIDGITYCGIEKAFQEGRISFQKPISCHLYPIRVKKMDEMEALNYDKWEICSEACVLGEQMKMPIYKFLKEPLIRKYGEEFYEVLDQAANEIHK